jgi:hypothetical protein
MHARMYSEPPRQTESFLPPPHLNRWFVPVDAMHVSSHPDYVTSILPHVAHSAAGNMLQTHDCETNNRLNTFCLLMCKRLHGATNYKKNIYKINR